MQLLETWLRTPLVWRTVVLALLSLQAALIITHRPWLDEWQALQIALQSPTLSDLFANLRYEGHPALWYLLLRSASNIVPTFWVLPVVALAIAIPTQLVVLHRSPFPQWQRLAIAVGALLLFDYMTISRSMTLGVACLIAAAALRRSRWMWLFLALLPQCDFLFGVLSLLLVTLVVRDRAIWWPGLALFLLSGLTAAWTVVPATDMVQALALEGLAVDIASYFVRLSVLLVPLQTVGNTLQWNGTLPIPIGLIVGPFFIVFAARQLMHDRLHLILFLLFLALTFAFSISVYPLHTRHLSLVALFLVILKWREIDDGKVTDRFFGAWLAIGAACGLVVATVAFMRPFDTSDQVAAFIEKHRLGDERWMVYPNSRASGVSALTGMEFELVGFDCTHSFTRWNKPVPYKDWQQFEQALRAKVARDGRQYLLTDLSFDHLPRSLAQPLAKFEQGYAGYAYRLYVLGPDAPRKEGRAPPCAPTRRPLIQKTVWER